MPRNIVDIDLRAETGAAPQETFTDPALVGTAAESPPDAEFGEVNSYSSAADVADDYGEDSDVAVASEELAARGVERWRVVQFEETEHTETLGDGETLENTPVLGNADVTSEDGTVEASVDDPPEVGEETADIVYNADIGAIATESAEVTIEYSTAAWDFDELPDDVDLLAVADRRMGREHIGVLNAAQSWASANDVGIVAAGINVSAQPDLATAKEIASDVAGYVPSGDLLMLVDNSSQEIAASLLGDLATSQPWYNPFWADIPAGEPIREGVGDPGTEGTFEGGSSEGDGPVNAIISVDGVNRLSNSLTTAGAASDLAFFDIARTKVFTAARVTSALESLQASQNIPFTSDGRAQVKSAIIGALSPITGGPRDPLAETEIIVPEIDDDVVDRENRVWGGIEIEARLAGSAHQFGVELTVTA